ncbi:hypothetical protein BC826DRAFT_1107890 [Russula brevipes]|nr:hypothetical protein BC826DRAFT_1107890 [Russula brevipes]
MSRLNISGPARPTAQSSSSIPTPQKAAAHAQIDADEPEEGEAMEAVNDDDEAMMAMMGLNGFGSTKGQHVVGNQDGGAHVKKPRTWRQRGGFNRPLDKIK